MLAQLGDLAVRRCARAAAFACGALLIASCMPRPVEGPAAAPSGPSTDGMRPPPGALRYTVDAAHSVVTIRVYRAGPLARFGHNHVISSSIETGHVWTNGEPAGSGFDVRVPVAGLVVDDPAARAGAGADFAGDVPNDAREGTRRNLLRPEVLDAQRYPEIVVRARSLGGSWRQPVVRASISIRDHTQVVEVPLVIERTPGSLRARGSFHVRQTDFGMTPFSVAGGAIQVADEVEVMFDVAAREE